MSRLAKPRCPRLLLLAILLFPGLSMPALRGQSVSATVRGRVGDASGGIVSGAQVTLRDTEKGVSYRTLTDSMGLYQVPVPVGLYEVEAAANGFAPAKQTGISLSVGQTVTADFTLQVGGLQESIEVYAEPPLVDSSGGTISGLVDRERLADLPLNGRDFGQLALLQPGVVPNHNGADPTPFGGQWSNFLINGQIDQATLFLIDGSDINDLFSGRTPSGSSGLLLGLDGVQEFQVLLNNYRAEFGRNSGGVIRVVTRSGSNQLHGSAFEYLRNSSLDAKNFFDLPDRPIPAFRRNQFGGSLGGPLHKDQTFFFLNYEGLRERKGLTRVATVPAEGARASVSPAVGPFLNLYPLPNGAVNPDGKTASLISSAIQRTNEDYGLARVDHRLAGQTTLFGRVSVQDSFSQQPFPSTPVPGFPNEVIHRNIYSLLGTTSALGANSVNQFHFAFNRTREDILLPPAPGGLSISPVPGRSFGLVVVRGLSNLGNQIFSPFGVAQNLFEVVDNFSYRRGRHSQKYGGSIQRYQANEFRGTFFNGQNVFLGLGPFLAGTPISFVGVLGGAAAGGNASPAGWRWTAYNFFAQDDIEVRPNLTVNLGIRYEFSTTPSEVNGRQANLRSPLDSRVNVGGQLFNTIARSVAPRFGFAWSPFADSRAVLRGGYGIFFNSLVVNMYGNSRLVPPFVETVSIFRPPFPNPLASGRTPTLSTTGQSIDFHVSQPYSQQWNLQWQQPLSSNWVAKVAYVGNRTVHVIRSLEANPATPILLPDGGKFFPEGTPRRNPNFGPIRGRRSDGSSWYNALQASLEKRLGNGFAFQGSYTWSKALSTNNSSFHAFPSQPSNTQDPDDPFLDKGLSAFDARNRLVLNFHYQVPSAGWSGGWSRLLGGWSVSGIASFSSGLPFTVIDGFNRSRNLQALNTVADRPHLRAGFSNNPVKGVTAGCAGVKAGQKLGGPDLFFDPCAFELQTAGFLGNLGRNTLIGPGLANVDFSIEKRFALPGEEQHLLFRAEFFNLFNRPNFATPRSPTGAQVAGGVIVFPDASGLPAGNAGQIFGTVVDSRQIQFSLRYRF